jgi:uncharacterized protein
MKYINIYKIFFLFFLIICSCKTQQDEKSSPSSNIPKVEFTQYDMGQSDLPLLKSKVNDFEFVFTLEQSEKLTLMIREFEKNTSNQIVIVSIESIGKYTDFEKFAVDLSKFNGIGLKEKNNGLTIVFSKNLRQIRISTGSGTEQILTNEICKKILDQIIIPEFKNDDYYSGIEKGLMELMAKWK